LLYEILTGQRPFPGDDLPALLNGHLNLPPPKPSEHITGLPRSLDAVIGNGMAKKPEQRYGSASQLAAAGRAALVTVDGTSATPPMTTKGSMATKVPTALREAPRSNVYPPNGAGFPSPMPVTAEARVAENSASETLVDTDAHPTEAPPAPLHRAKIALPLD